MKTDEILWLGKLNLMWLINGFRFYWIEALVKLNPYLKSKFN